MTTIQTETGKAENRPESTTKKLIMSSTIFKTLFLMLAFGLTSSNIMGQLLKDYYIPSQSNLNKASFYMVDTTGRRTDLKRVIYYVNNEDGTYDITDSHMSQRQPSAIVTRTVKFTPTQVVMTNSISTTFFKTNEKQSYEPARTLLKMPASGKTATWTVAGKRGGKPTIFNSSWTTLTIDGVIKKAIKVISQYTGWKVKTAEYYVEGIGLCITEFIDEDGNEKPYENFDGLSYEVITR